MGIVDEHVVYGVAVLADFHGFHQEAVAHQPLFVVISEEHFLAVAQVDCAVGTECLVGHVGVYAVVENHAILQDFNHGCAFVVCRSHHHLLRGCEVHVDCACEEVAACAEHKFGRDKRVLGGSVRG